MFLSSLGKTGDEGKLPTTVNVENCSEDAEYCEVRRNEDFKVQMSFESETKKTNLKATMHALVGGKWMKFLMGRQSKVCENLIEAECPLKPNTKATYSFKIKIPFIAPVGIKTVIQLKIADDNNDVVTCVRAPVLIAA